jgi:DNA excision repair protein ERCC-4
VITPIADTVLVVDTREQRPWRFPDDVVTVRACLPAGDYSVVGLETRIAIERKELGDFVNCCTHERERFKRELEKLHAYDFAAVIVESNLVDIGAGVYRSRATPQSIIGTAAAITLDYCPVLFASDRVEAARYARVLLTRFARKAREAGTTEAA